MYEEANMWLWIEIGSVVSFNDALKVMDRKGEVNIKNIGSDGL